MGRSTLTSAPDGDSELCRSPPPTARNQRSRAASSDSAPRASEFRDDPWQRATLAAPSPTAGVYDCDRQRCPEINRTTNSSAATTVRSGITAARGRRAARLSAVLPGRDQSVDRAVAAVCAILDADVVSAVFTEDPAPGAREFRRWIESGTGRLVVGGRLRKELAVNRAFNPILRTITPGRRLRS